MKKILLFMAFMLISSIAYGATWVKIGTVQNHTIYVDGNYPKVFKLVPPEGRTTFLKVDSRSTIYQDFNSNCLASGKVEWYNSDDEYGFEYWGGECSFGPVAQDEGRLWVYPVGVKFTRIERRIGPQFNNPIADVLFFVQEWYSDNKKYEPPADFYGSETEDRVQPAPAPQYQEPAPRHQESQPESIPEENRRYKAQPEQSLCSIKIVNETPQDWTTVELNGVTVEQLSSWSTRVYSLGTCRHVRIVLQSGFPNFKQYNTIVTTKRGNQFYLRLTQ